MNNARLEGVPITGSGMLAAGPDVTFRSPTSTSAEARWEGDVNGLVFGRVLWGWAVDVSDPHMPTTVEVEIGPRRFTVAACRQRRDLVGLFNESGTHGFELEIPPELLTPGMSVNVCFADGVTPVPHGEMTFDENTLSQIGAAPPATYDRRGEHNRKPTVGGFELFGNIQAEGEQEVEGWIACSTRVVNLLLYVDELLVGVTHLVKSDPEGEMHEHSFLLTLPTSVFDDRSHVIKLIALVNGIEEQLEVISRFLPRQSVPDFVWRSMELIRGKFTGFLVASKPWSLNHTVALSVEGQIVALGVVAGRAGYAEMRLDLEAATASEWLGKSAIIQVLDEAAIAPIVCTPLLHEAVRIFGGDEERERGEVRVELPMPLLGRVEVSRLQEQGPIARSAVQLGMPTRTLRIPLPEMTDELPRNLQLNGIELGPASDRPLSVLEEGHSSLNSDFEEPGTVILPTDRSVRDVILALGSGRAIERPHEPGPVATGAWRLGQGRIEGWAIDLRSPERTLAVTICVDDQPVFTALANQPVAPLEAGATQIVTCGFGIDLNLLCSAGSGIRRLSVRLANGGALPPANGILVELPEVGRQGPTPDDVDRLMCDELIGLAYLSACAAQPDREIWKRRLALDLCLRRSWVGNENTGSAHAFGEIGIGPDVLAQLYQRFHSGDREAVDSALARLGLPPIYREVVSKRLKTEQTGSDRLDGEAVWITVSQLASLPRERLLDILAAPSGAAVILDVGESPSELTEPSVGVGDVRIERFHPDIGRRLLNGRLGAGDVADLTAAIRHASVAVILQQPRRVFRAAASLWPLLATAFPKGILTTSASTGLPAHSPQRLNIRELGRVGTVLSGDVIGQLQPHLSELSEEHPHDLTNSRPSTSASYGSALAEYVVGGMGSQTVPADKIVVVVASGHDPEQQILDAPRNTRMVRSGIWSKDGAIARADLRSVLDRIRDLGLVKAVIFMQSGILYPARYVSDAIREFEMAGRRDVAFLEASYDPASMSFHAYPPIAQFVRLGFLGMGIYQPQTLAELAELTAPAEHRFVVGHSPIVAGVIAGLATERNLRVLRRMIAPPTVAMAEKQIGFDARYRRAHYQFMPGKLALGEQPGLHIVFDEANSGIFKSESMRKIIDMGKVREGRALIAEALRNFETILALADPDVSSFLDYIRVVGLEREFLNALRPHLGKFVSGNTTRIIALCEIAALVMDPEELSVFVIAVANFVLHNTHRRPVRRLIVAAQRYCSPSTLIMLLTLIDHGQHWAILRESSSMQAVGDALLGRQSAQFRLARCGLTDGDFYAAASSETKLIYALRSFDKAGFLTAVNRCFARGVKVPALAKLLRTYTDELAAFQIGSGEVLYPDHAVLEEVLQLAVILGDHGFVENAFGHGSLAAGTTSDPSFIIWRSSLGDYLPANAALDQVLEDFCLQPVRLAGSSLYEVFESVSVNHDLPSAADHGLVSIICTVYNPDPGLLKVAIRSMLAQTYRNLEVILVDDGSDEPFSEVIAGVQNDPRVILLRNDRNSGPYHCRNLALTVAKGVFVAIHDGDDVAHPQRIEAQVARLSSEPLFSMSTSAHLRIDISGRLQFEQKLELFGDGTMSSMFRRSVFEKLGGFAAVRSRGDVEYRHRVTTCLGAHTVTHLTCPLLFCLGTPSSLSNRVASNLPAYLGLFRDSFARRYLPPVFNDPLMLPSEIELFAVPYPLRPSTIM